MSPPDEPTHELKSDSRFVWNGSRSAWLGTETPAEPRAFMADIMWQTIDAAPYRGSRIEFSVQLRGSDAFLVQVFVRSLRAPDRELVLTNLGTPAANFMWGNVFDRWLRIPLVQDVPVEADVIAFGVAIYNGGHLWIDDARLSTVPTTIPVTHPPKGLVGERFGLPLERLQPFAAPTNLDFEATNLDSTGIALAFAGC